MGLFLQGLKTSEGVAYRAEPAERASTQIDNDSITGQFRAVAALGGAAGHQQPDLPDERRNRVERRRTRNPVFEARARRVGMALDRRRRRGWVAALLVRCKVALRSTRRLGARRDTSQRAPAMVSPNHTGNQL